MLTSSPTFHLASCQSDSKDKEECSPLSRMRTESKFHFPGDKEKGPPIYFVRRAQTNPASVDRATAARVPVSVVLTGGQLASCAGPELCNAGVRDVVRA